MSVESESNQEAFQQIITYVKGLRQEIATHKKQIGELKEHCDKCDQSKKTSQDDALTGKYCRDCGRALRISEMAGDCPACGCHYYSTHRKDE